MTAPPAASVAAVQKALEAEGLGEEGGIHSWRCFDKERYPEPCTCVHEVAVAAADAAVQAATPGIQAGALREFADTRGVNVGDEDDAWWLGYRQAQRECLLDAVREADRIEANR